MSEDRSPKYIDFKDFPSVRKKVDPQVRAPAGRRAWRSLDELGDTPEFRAMMDREFPQAASEWDDNVSRRNFIKLMGASIALAGLTTACAPKPEEKIIPYVQQPENLVPGKPLFYASAMPWGGFGKGVLVEQHEGRPTKIEGNPDHPASMGASDVWGQGTILTLYDPDRAQALTKFGNVTSWGSFLNALDAVLNFEDWNGAKVKRRATAGARIRLLTETITSPSLKAQIEALKGALGDKNLVWHTHDAVGRDNIREGAKQAFGADVEPIYNFAAAKTIVSLDSNFLVEDPGSLRYAKDYIANRRVGTMTEHPRATPDSRLYVIESSPTIVGAMADARLRARPEKVHEFAIALHKAISEGKSDGATFAGVDWFGGLVKELLENKGKSLVVAGEYAPVEVHVLAHGINAALGNIATSAQDAGPSTAPAATRPASESAVVPSHAASLSQGKPVSLIPVVEANPVNGAKSLRELTDAIKANEVDALFILGGNPVYTAPADIAFEDVLKGLGDGKKVFVAHLGLYEDETARLCEWHIPEAHWLEAWGDVRAHDGTASIIQPLISPLYVACRSQLELIAAIFERTTVGLSAPTTRSSEATARPPSPGGTSTSGYEIVRGYWQSWQQKAGGKDFERFWVESLHNGIVAGSAADYAPQKVEFKGDVAAASKVKTVAQGSANMTLILRPDPNVWDGHLANNAWLQELPKPLTKITWDNALLISPAAAAAIGKSTGSPLASDELGHVFKAKYSDANEKTVDLTVGGRTLKGVPVWVLPGHPDGCATLHLGYGRTQAGKVGSPTEGQVGFNAYALRTSDARWSVQGADAQPAGGKYRLAVTQNHQVINQELNHKRELVRHGSGAEHGEDLHGVADEFIEELDKREGRDHKHPPHGEEPKYDEGTTIEQARRVGLPILPDDAGLSASSLFPANPDQGNARDNDYPAWGMVIDQTACIGCNACVMACTAENNVPVVGKQQVINEREMHWLRIDTYYVGNPIDKNADPEGHDNDVLISDNGSETRFKTFFQPLPCMQCEKAPCELVCPVGATVHSKEGLNDMAYNRCVGTRYCSNNCPYKVRRFNFLKYVDDTTPVLKLLRNPEVTVRSRGVMEKCTYCVQRINRGRIEAKKEEVKLRVEGKIAEGTERFNEILRTIETACQQACPTDAIIFGNMIDPKSKIYKLKREPVGFHYGLLAELNTRPRTTYLARIDNEPPKAGEAKPGHTAPATTHG